MCDPYQHLIRFVILCPRLLFSLITSDNGLNEGEEGEGYRSEKKEREGSLNILTDLVTYQHTRIMKTPTLRASICLHWNTYEFMVK